MRKKKSKKKRQNEEKLTKHKTRNIDITTLGGILSIKRTILYNRNNKKIEIPKDEYLKIANLPFKITKEMMVELAFYAQNQVSFEDAKYMIEKTYHIQTNAETIREVAEYVGKQVFEKDTKEAEEKYEKMYQLPMLTEQEKEDITLYLLTDGAAVNTRIEDENGSTWRENKLVMAFTSKDMIKRPDGNHIITKKEYGAYIGSVEEFKKYMLNVALKAGYCKVKNVVIISDGATWIRNACKEIFPDAIQILDKFHLEENLFSYARYKYGEDEKAYTKWVKMLMKYIEKGNKEKALKVLKKEDYSKLPAGVPNILGYVKNNIDKIDYQNYKERGYFVGSGAIESGNKVVLQRRCKQAGMRWSVSGAQYMLTLKSKWESNLWKEEVVLPICA